MNRKQRRAAAKAKKRRPGCAAACGIAYNYLILFMNPLGQ